eukprot:gene16956-22448_t
MSNINTLTDPTLERTFKGHKSYITSISFSSTLKQLVSGSGDNCVMLWNFRPQLRAFRLLGHKGVITDVQFSPQGEWIASASKDKTVRLCKAESVTLKGHTGAVRSVNFSNDTRHLLTSSDDKTIKVWGLPSRKFICSLVGHSNWSGNYLLSSSKDSSLKIWDLREGRLLFTLQGHQGPVFASEFTNDGNFFASGGSDQLVMVWRSNLLDTPPAIEWGEAKTSSDSVSSALSAPSIQKKSPSITPTSVSSTPPPNVSFGSSVKPKPIKQSSRFNSLKPTKQNTVDENIRPISKNITKQINKSSNEPLKAQLPDTLSSAMNHIIGQLNIINQTLALLDQRLTYTEDRVSMILAHTRGLTKSNDESDNNIESSKQDTTYNQSAFIPNDEEYDDIEDVLAVDSIDNEDNDITVDTNNVEYENTE